MVRVELEKMWNSEAIVVPVIIGGLGSIFHNFINFLKMINAWFINGNVSEIGSEKFMRSFLSRKWWNLQLSCCVTWPNRDVWWNKITMYGLMLPIWPKLFVQCWITFEVCHHEPKPHKNQIQKKSEMPLELGQSSAISLNLPRQFLGATKHLYNWLCPSVGLLVDSAFVRRSTRRTLLAYLALFLVQVHIKTLSLSSLSHSLILSLFG